MTISTTQLGSIAIYLKEPKLSLFTSLLNTTMDIFDINTPSRQAEFLAQVMHESGECHYLEEIASGEAYEGREDLGNVNPGDGVKYKGRGLIQITGRANYQLASDFFHQDFINNPTLLAEPEWAVKSAGWFWATHHLGQFADTGTEAAFEIETRRINGGLNGLADRETYWNRAKKELGVETA